MQREKIDSSDRREGGGRVLDAETLRRRGRRGGRGKMGAGYLHARFSGGLGCPLGNAGAQRERRHCALSARPESNGEAVYFDAETRRRRGRENGGTVLSGTAFSWIRVSAGNAEARRHCALSGAVLVGGDRKIVVEAHAVGFGPEADLAGDWLGEGVLQDQLAVEIAL